MMNIHTIYKPILRYFRTRRMRQFAVLFQPSETTTVLDAGGSTFNWSLMSAKPSLTIANIYSPKAESKADNWIVSDGRYLPFRDGAFDIVYSNSVIEHLGDFDSQRVFAKEVCRVGKRYFVQTPNRWFLIEPHFLTPFIHYLPKSIQRRLLRNFSVWGLIGRPTEAQCEAILAELRLLDVDEMKQLFPDAALLQERVLGFTKSIVAIRA